jgi:hypothetical protein
MRPWGCAAAAIMGALFAAWIGGPRLIDPTQIGWVMQLDWQYHFLGWHFFRDAPWQFPPGLMKSYNAPLGTAIGFTDSIPLVALLLKPLASALPMPFQYLGLWLVFCFALQGAFGALVTAVWSTNAWIQMAGGAVFVLVPALLGRVGHPALASHWLLLWALWMYMREGNRPVSWRMHAAWGVVAGLVHPYLAAMGMLIVGALAVRRILEARSHPNAQTTRVGDPGRREESGRPRRPETMLRRMLLVTGPFFASSIGVVAGWWCSGLLSVSGRENLVSSGLDQFSMNLLAPITPTGWSTLLPELPLARSEQKFEGFQYLGAGVLALAAVALAAAIIRRQMTWRATMPLVAAVTMSALYALSPRVTFGSNIVLDLTTPAMSQFAIFRATGRFFWPAAYALVAAAIAGIVATFRPRIALAVLAGALLLQAIDLNTHYRTLRQATHSDAFHTWQETLLSPVWNVALPHYRRMLFYGPSQCGPAPAPFENAAFLAGMHGLSINTGHMARSDQAAAVAYCLGLRRDFDAGVVSDDAIYLVNGYLLDRFRANAQRPVVCATLDRIPVCVTAASYEPWKNAAELQ